MDYDTIILLLTTASVGCIHTLIGPDHYLPFIALSESRRWPLPKTIGVTAACGVGHVLSAVGLGIAAASIGGLLSRLDAVEALRGEIAAWLLTAFGFVYFVWGLRSAARNEAHRHPHPETGRKDSTPWILFLIFVFGPCEPLIPLIMYPASRQSAADVALVAGVFGLSTLAVMLAVVAASSFGLRRAARFPFFERFGNAAAGGVILSCGLAMTFLGL